MKKMLSIVLVLVMTLTLIQVPTYAVGENGINENVKSSIDSMEELTAHFDDGRTHYEENDYMSISVSSREEYQLITNGETNGNASVVFQLEDDSTKTFRQEFDYYQNTSNGDQVQICGNLDKLNFGKNCTVKIIEIQINDVSYKNINSNQGLSFTYSDIIIPKILSVVPDENNKAVYDDEYNVDQFAFYVNLEQPIEESGVNCSMLVTNNDGDTRYVYLMTDRISDTQFKIYFDINSQQTFKGKYTFESLNVDRLYIDKNSELYNSLNLSQLTFEVTHGEDDFKAPVLENITSNIQSGATITGNQRIVYTLTLSNDDDIYLPESYVSVYNADGYTLDLKLQKTAKDHEYTVTLLCDNTTSSGEYNVERVQLCDKGMNHNQYYYNDYEMINCLRFTVSNGDVISDPLKILNITSSDSLYLNEENPTYELTIEFNKEVTDSSIRILRRFGDSQNTPKADINGNIVKYTMTYTENMRPGDYYVEYFYATTGFETISEYNNSDSQFSNVGFTVIEKGQPLLNSINFDKNGQQVKPNSQLMFNLDFTSLVSFVSLHFRNETHEGIEFYAEDNNFNSQSGILDAYTSNKPNGHYKLTSIRYRINDNSYEIDVNSEIGKKLGLNNISFDIIESHEDFVAPKITNVEFDETQNMHFTSQNDHFEFYVTVDEKLEGYPSFNFMSEDEGWLENNVELIDENLLKYKVTVHPNSRSYDGIYFLNSINISDQYDNTRYYSKYNIGEEGLGKLFDLSFDVSVGVQRPDEINLSYIDTTFKEIYSENGETVIRFNTNVSCNYVSLSMINITYNRNQYISANKLNFEGTEWEIRININESILKGFYRIENINFEQIMGNYSSIYYYNLPEELQNVKYYVECGKEYTKPPKIKTLSADLSNKYEYTQSGDVIFNLTTTSPIKFGDYDGTGNLSSVEIKMKGYDKYIHGEFEEVGTNQYRIICHIDEKSFNGTYYIENLRLAIDDDETYYSAFDNEKGTYYLSGMEFKVSCGISDIKAPKLVNIYGDAANKKVYTEDGIFTYYFEFDEEITINRSYVNIENENFSRMYGSLIPLGNKVYALRFDIHNEDRSNSYNGKYRVTNLRFVDKYNNETYADLLNDYYNNSSNLGLFRKDLDKIQFDVNLDNYEIDKEPLNILSCTPFENVVFNEWGRQEIFQLKTNIDISEIHSEIVFMNENEDRTFAYISRFEKVDDGYITTFSVNVDMYFSKGEYTLCYATIYNNVDGYIDIPFDDLTTKPIQFINNADRLTIDVSKVEFIDLKESYDNVDDKINIDITLDKKLDGLLEFNLFWLEKEDGFAEIWTSVVSVEEINGQYVYHLIMPLNEFYGPAIFKLQSLTIYYEGCYIFGCGRNSDDPVRIEMWDKLNLEDVLVQTEFNKNNNMSYSSDMTITPLDTNQSIYESEGTQSYIITSKENFDLFEVLISNYDDSIQVDDYTITKISDNEFRVDIHVSSLLKNDIYRIRTLSYTQNGGTHYFWAGGLDTPISFAVNCGMNDVLPLKVLNVTDIVNEKVYDIQKNDNGKLSCIIEFNKPVKEIKADFYWSDDMNQGNEDISNAYSADVEKIDDTHYKVMMTIDEVFESGYYHQSIYVKDEAGQIVYVYVAENLDFKVINELDQSDSDLLIKLESQTLENGETIARNEWVNEPVTLNMKVVGDNEEVTYMISTDGVHFEKYNSSLVISSTDKIYVKAVNEDQTESNVVAVNVRIDTDKPIGEILEPITSFSLDVENKGLVYTIVSSDDLSGIKSVEYKLVPSGEDESRYPYKSGSKVTVASNFDGTLYARITDNAHNVTILTKEIVAQVHLTLELKGNTNGLINQDTLHINIVKDEYDEIEFVGIKFNGNDYENITDTYNEGYVIDENGTYSVLVQTVNGGQAEKTITYRNICSTDNLLQINGETGKSITEDILDIQIKDSRIIKSVTIKRDSDEAVDITNTYADGYIISKNGTYTVVLTTTSNDEIKKTITYNNVFVPDTSLKFSLDYNMDDYLEEDTVLFLISPKDTQITSLKVYKNGVEIDDITSTYKFGYKVTENGNYKFVLDVNGEVFERSITYSKFDKTQPELTLNGNVDCTDFTDTLFIDVKPDSSGIQFIKIQRAGDDAVNITDNYEKGYTINANGIYTVTLVTVSGKVVSKTIEYKNLAIPYISLDKTSLRLKPGENYSFKVDTNLNELEWISSDTNIVTVENGVVTAVANGTATIIVKSGNAKIECEVFVSDLTYQLGDVNRDGSVDTLDASLILQYSVGLIELDDEQLILADVSGDNSTDTLDASLILQYSVGLISQFPIKK